MKKYIALKAVKFDKKYQKGEEVPENVIAPKMITKLERCGCIAVREVEEEQNQEELPQQEQEEQNQEELPQQEQEEQNQEELPQQEQEEQTTQGTEKELLQYKKEELEHMAEQKGLELKQGMTKNDIVALLLQKE